VNSEWPLAGDISAKQLFSNDEYRLLTVIHPQAQHRKLQPTSEGTCEDIQWNPTIEVILRKYGFRGNVLRVSRHYRVDQDSFLRKLDVSSEAEELCPSQLSKSISTKYKK